LTSPRKIRISPRALGQIEKAAEWWAQNRPSAPDAIRHDVAEILNLLCVQPGIGAPARRSRAKGVRRVTLSRVRYYLYYRVSAEFVDVLAFWHTSRQGQPRM
jgi:plasmid stabilization system protein ParE